ncbi:glycerophosphodiester phosphodiesterase family protein [Streptomyces sp. P1-3]|uniref:glycerophosphodiester phosphodiesterase family protein n=1 Tax=Streptomyces sp. P1-3 TaxID=3421658 RepID=UPI003D36CEAD
MRTQKRPWIIAHRAGTSDYPENTLLAIEESLKAGVDGEWLSVQATKDGVPVLYRPTDLSALTDGSGAVSSKTLAELADLNAGYAFKRPDGTYPYRSRPLRIPTLEAALQAVPEGKQVYLDLKQAPAWHVVDAVTRVLDATKAWHRVKLYSTDAQVTSLLERIPGAQVAESRDATVTAQLWTPDSVRCFRSHGRTPIVMLGVNTPTDLRDATRLGATTVVVDSPRTLLRPGR